MLDNKYLAITIGEVELDLSRSTEGAAHNIVGVIRGGDHGPFTLDASRIRNLSSEIPSTLIPNNLSATINDVVLASTENAKLLSANCAIDLDLTSLPIVGHLVSQDFNFSADSFQVMLSTGAVDETDSGYLNDIMPTGIPKLPDTVKKGFSLTTAVNVGGATDALEVSTASKTQSQQSDLGDSAPQSSIPSAWLNVNKSLGSLHISKLGVGYEAGDAFVLVDASVTTGNLTMGVIGLGLGSSLEAFAPAFTIEGIDLSFSDGPVRIAGGLRGSLYPLSFTGELLIETSELNIAALGAYAKVDDHPSFFSYAVLDDPIGGPAFFYVTGLAAGFGFNRKLVIPNVDGVATFPFVEWAMDTGNPPGMATGSNAGQQVNQVLTRLTQGGVVAPSIGEDWLAVGVRFTSFEMIRSFALLTAEFGNEFEIALLGLSTLQVPNNDPAPVAVAELALDARFIPASGILSVAAVLTPNSYILSRSCRLTGGFAFDAWFGSNPHEGDFVVTFGGYNPHYHLPGWYPPEPRIGFRWLDGPVTISGDCYFALVPHVVMAGGGLNVVYQEGRIRAWLTVYADFLIEWKPFHYEIDAGVSIGASVRVGFPIYSTIKVELSADIEIWGPPMAGKAHISVMVFSVTVHFGADMANSEPAPLSWDEFQSAFLPQHKSEGAELVLEADASPASKTDAVSVRIASGIIKQVRDDKTGEISYTIVNADELALSTASVIPSTSVTVQGSNQSLPSDAATKLYVRPMKQQEVTLNSQHVVVMSGVAHTGADASPVLDTEVHLKNVPTALWGEPGTEGIPALNPEGGSLVKNAVTGTRLTVSPPQQPGGDIGPFPLNRLEFDAPCFHTLFWGVFRSSPAEGYDQSEAISQIEQTIEVNNQRNTILDELKSAGLDIVTAVDPSDIGENAKEIFYQAPILSRLGDLPPTQPGAG